MATEYLYIRGKGSWIKTTQPNPWGKWCGTIHPIPEDLEKIRELTAAGCKNQIKKDEDGYYVTFNRPTEKVDKSGRRYGLNPIEVQLADGSKYEGLIGNGSDVTFKLEVYQHKTPGGGTAKAARLMAIRVDNLIPYDPEVDRNPHESKLAEGLKLAPTQPARF